MQKKTIAVFFGGMSPEYSVSLESAYGILSHMDRERFTPVPVGITREGKWFAYAGPLEAIRDDTWQGPDCRPALVSPNFGDASLLVARDGGWESIPLDAAFPVLHGRFGEDGTIQGLLEMAGIPLVGCGVLASALCMDKVRAHKLALLSGVSVPKATVLQADYREDTLDAICRTASYPLFVKPLRAGSSFGITKVKRPQELREAIAYAFQYDDTVLLEEAIEGFEVGCAVLGNRELFVGEVDEIELSGDFFDFTEKYTLKTSTIHVPAHISPALSKAVKETAKTLYRALGCNGFARVDLFITPAGQIYFNEINTIPGFTAHSRYPGMMAAAGLPFQELLTRIILLGCGEDLQPVLE